MRHVFIINPVAGKGRAEKTVIPIVSEYFKRNRGSYKILVTEQKGDATKFAYDEVIQGDEVNIFACGGEGTAFEVLNGVVGYPNASIGVIPCGSANDFIKYFGDPSVFMNIEHQVKGTAFPIDIIKAGDSYALNQCSAGMDAMVADNMRMFKRWPGISGSMAYNLSIIYTFFKKSGVSLEITIDGKKSNNLSCLFAVCANAPYYGGGYKSAPFAVPGDGLLDYSIIATQSRLKVLTILKDYRRGRHVNLKCCNFGNCESMEIKSDRPIPVNLDGEIIFKDSINFSIVKKGVKFIVPSVICDKFDEKLKAKAQHPSAVPNVVPACEARNK